MDHSGRPVSMAVPRPGSNAKRAAILTAPEPTNKSPWSTDPPHYGFILHIQFILESTTSTERVQLGVLMIATHLLLQLYANTDLYIIYTSTASGNFMITERACWSWMSPQAVDHSVVQMDTNPPESCWEYTLGARTHARLNSKCIAKPFWAPTQAISHLCSVTTSKTIMTIISFI